MAGNASFPFWKKISPCIEDPNELVSVHPEMVSFPNHGPIMDGIPLTMQGQPLYYAPICGVERKAGLLIHVDDIKPEGLVLELEETSTAFPVLHEMTESGDCRFSAPIHISLRALHLHDLVEVEGRVGTMVRYSCSRCLKEFDLPVEEDFAVTYARHLPAVHEEDDEGSELTAEDLGLILFHGDDIDLTEAIQDQVIMALPVRPLCSDECKGLCARCGADLNQGACGCDRSDFNIKFSALKDLKINKK
jgi:uncharacterized protein